MNFHVHFHSIIKLLLYYENAVFFQPVVFIQPAVGCRLSDIH